MIPRTRGGALWRSAAACVIVILFTASATAVAGLLQFKQIAKEISYNKPIPHAPVTIADPGKPQTLLLIGSDHRAGTPWKTANTDTMMLVRIDPNSATINLLSIPRDLEVQIAGYGTQKLNAAYSIGGPGLLVHILKTQVFPGLRVNHIIDVNFGGFEGVVNAIGCVYTDVDHRYYNNTIYTDYSSIDIQPGYQKLCGSDALAFVRFRHTDNDLVRNARQQDFLRWAKDQFSSSELISEKDKLLTIFGKNTQTDHDLQTIDGVINLFNLVAFSAGHAVKQIPFPAIILPCGGGAPPAPAGQPQPVQQQAQTPCYVSADPGAEAAAFHAFMTPTKARPPATPAGGAAGGGSGGGGSGGGGSGGGGSGGGGSSGGGSGGGGSSGGGSGGGGSGGGGSSGGGSAQHRPPPAPHPTDVTGDVPDGIAQVKALGRMGMPVYFPHLIASGSRYCTNGTCVEGPVLNSYPRPYVIWDQHGKAYAAYRMTLVVNPILGQYYGVQGMSWQSPPILEHPTATRDVAGKHLLLYANGGKLSVVAWHTRAGVYWISNTLTDDLSNDQMIAIAASLSPAGH